MNLFLLSLGFGFVTASILALTAVGFTVQFGVTNLFNLAYGDVMTIGAFVGYVFHNDVGINIWLAMPVAGLAAAIASLLIARVLYVPFQRRGATLFVMSMVTISMSLILRNLIQIVVGIGTYSYQLPPQSTIRILGMEFSPNQLGIIAVAVVSMIALHLLFKFTRIGKAMRATSDDPGLARSCGIATTRVVSVAWLASGFLCGVGGVALGISLGEFDINIGFNFLFVIIAAAVFGSVGQPYGAMVGALVVGIVSELAALINPDLKEVFAFGVLVIVLLVRPEGLRGGRVQVASREAVI